MKAVWTLGRFLQNQAWSLLKAAHLVDYLNVWELRVVCFMFILEIQYLGNAAPQSYLLHVTSVQELQDLFLLQQDETKQST